MAIRWYKRSKWGARPARELHPHTVPSNGVVFIHHSAGQGMGIDSFVEQCAVMRSIQNYHMDTKGWDDIGYSHVVFQPQGRLRFARAFIGRSFKQIPAAQEGNNTGNGAICVVGNFQTEKVKWSTVIMVALVARRWPGKYVGGHRDVTDTTCPGDKLYARLDNICSVAQKQRLR